MLSICIVFHFPTSSIFSWTLYISFSHLCWISCVRSGNAQVFDVSHSFVIGDLTQTAIGICLLYLQHHTGVTTIQPLDLSFQLMPMDKYQPDTSYIQIISSLYFVLAYAQFVNFLTANIVNDKEKKIKEGMKMMGLRDSAYWASWAAVYFVLITVVTIVVTLIAYLAQFYKNSNMFLFFLILELYGLSLISFSWLITPFFQKAQTAGGLASLISMVTSLLYLAVSMTRTVTSTGEVTYTIPPVGRAFLSLISPCGVALAIDQVKKNYVFIS